MSTEAPVSGTLRLIHRHRSIRKFKPAPLSAETVRSIVAAAQNASTSSYTQSYSVISITDPARRREMARLADDQEFVAEAGAFLVWCADLHRHQVACETHGQAIRGDGLEPFLVATVDTALAAQTAMLAAESMGLGGVYIGAIRRFPEEVSQLLDLPELVYPVFGMCFGYPDEDPIPRPRLPVGTVLHVDRYQTEGLKETLQAYDQVTAGYYARRSGGTLRDTWTARMARLFGSVRRPELRRFLESRGFLLR